MKNLPDFKKAIEVAYKEVIKEKRERINELIFELRSIADPKLKESYKKYLIGAEKDFISYMEHPEWRDLIPEEGIAAKKKQERTKLLEKLKKQVLEQLYNENEQEFFFKFVFMLITENFHPDYSDDSEMEFVTEAGMGVYSYLEEELKDLDADARSKFIEITGQDDPDLFIPTIEMTKKILENDLPDLLKIGMCYFEVIFFLEDLVKIYKATSEIKKGLFDLYDHDGYWESLDKKHLSKFLKTVKLREINENYLKEMMEDSMAIISGRMSSKLANEVAGIEGSLREMIKSVLKKDKGDDWFRKSVSKDTFSMCIERLRNDHIKDTDDPYHYLDLGGCKIVILHNWGEFEGIFAGPDGVFHNKEQFIVAIDFINEYRKPKSHGDRPYRPKYQDREMLQAYLKKINRCIDRVLNK